MDENLTPIALKLTIAGVLVATSGMALAVSVFSALNPPSGLAGGLSLDLIVRLWLPIASAPLTIAVPLVTLVRRQLRDPVRRAGGWGQPGIQAGMIAAGVIDLGLLAVMIFDGEFSAVFLPIAAVILVACILVGAGIGLLARALSLYFNRNWE